MKKVKYSFIAITSLVYSLSVAQNPSPSGGPSVNEIEENFYAALKEKSIENHDKAIDYLLILVKKEPNNPVFYNQLGKSYLALKNFPQAEKSFQKAIELDTKQKWYWADLYDVYYKTKDYKKSIPVVLKLIEFDKDYQDDLVSLYMHAKEYDKASFLLDSMEKESKLSVAMERYRLQILTEKSYSNKIKADYKAAVSANPTDERGYVNLIQSYLNNNQFDKVYDEISKLSKQVPNSDWVQVLNFREALKNNQYNQATKALTSVLNSSAIAEIMKHRSFNEYLIYVHQNDKHIDDLETYVDFFNDQQLVNVNKEVGIFFFNKNKIALAQQYLKKGIAKDKKDVQAVCLYVETYLSLNDLVTTEKLAQDYLAIYPSEARLYYFLGIAQQGLNNPKKAVKTLNEALDYLVDDSKLEASIYIQLGECYHKLGDEKQKEAFFIKASTILNK